MVKRINKFQFLAFSHHQRPPIFDALIEEHEWYSDDAENTLGVLFVDKSDDDWAYAVMQAGDTSLFECVAIDVSYEDKDTARSELLSEIDRIAMELQTKGSTSGRSNLRRSASASDPFVPIVPASRLNPNFQYIRNLPGYSPARGMIREVFSSYVDRDGNFIEQFQTTGFDSRIWELYLHAYLLDSGYNIHPGVSPDFIVSKEGTTVAIEAVTSNPTQVPRNGNEELERTPAGRILASPEDATFPDLDAAFEYKQKDYVPIKLGSALYSKLQKSYWEIAEITNVPLIFAIESFHEEASLHYSSAALGTYLYGYRHSHIWDPNGNLMIVPENVDSHSFGGKRIPSGFFRLPHSDRVSAVLFSNSGTISKFNRLGQQGAYHNPNIVLIRVGTCYDTEPTAVEPNHFRYSVGDPEFVEWWGQGLEMFHNPDALHPVDPDLFPDIIHHRLEDRMIYTNGPAFHPIASVTFNIATSGRYV